METLNGRIVLITGANGGLGTFVTNAFLRAGAKVTGVSRRIGAADFPHPNFSPLSAELSTGDGASRVVDQVIAIHGRLDAVVHLVGAWAGGAPIDAVQDDEFERMLDLNLRSAFHIFRAALPIMRAQSAGRILAVGARAGVTPLAGSAAYSAAKAALISLVRSVSLEYGVDGISANIVLPGTMDTPANRSAMPAADFASWVQPCQVAELLAHLASPAASNINGATIPIFGSAA